MSRLRCAENNIWSLSSSCDALNDRPIEYLYGIQRNSASKLSWIVMRSRINVLTLWYGSTSQSDTFADVSIVAAVLFTSHWILVCNTVKKHLISFNQKKGDKEVASVEYYYWCQNIGVFIYIIVFLCQWRGGIENEEKWRCSFFDMCFRIGLVYVSESHMRAY